MMCLNIWRFLDIRLDICKRRCVTQMLKSSEEELWPKAVVKHSERRGLLAPTLTDDAIFWDTW